MSKQLRKTLRVVMSMILVLAMLGGGHVFAEGNNSSRIENTEIKVVIITQEDIDLSQVTIDVSTSVLDQADEESGTLYYANTPFASYALSADGTITFKRPSDYVLIDLDMDTIPSGFGVSGRQFFLTPQDRLVEITLERVADISLEYNDGDVKPYFWGQTGMLETNYVLEEITNDVRSSVVFDDEEPLIFRQRQFVVESGNLRKTFTKTDTYRYEDEYEKAGYLLDIGYYSKIEYVERFIELLQSGAPRSVTVCGNDLIAEINQYLEDEDISNDDKEALRALEMNIVGSPSRLTQYVTSSGGYFRVQYDSALVTSAIAQAVANAFDSVRQYFVVNNGYPEPESGYMGNGYYIIEIKDLSYLSAAGACQPINNNDSYIMIDTETAQDFYDNTIDFGEAGVFAHEYMHAIVYKYCDDISNDDEQNWMHESFASFAGCLYCSNYGLHRRTSDVQQFIKTSNSMSLTYFDPDPNSINHSRHYGSLLFPLYLYEYKGGHSIIKKIYECYGINGGEPILAIKSALSSYQYIFGDCLANCYASNFNTNAFYSNARPSWNYHSTLAGGLTSYPSTDTKTIEALSCEYDVFKPAAADGSLVVTVYCPGTDIYIRNVNDLSSGSSGIYTYSLINNSCTIVKTNFGPSNTSAVAIIPVNTNTSGSVDYSRTATLSGVSLVRTYLEPDIGTCATSYIDKAPGTAYGSMPIPTCDGFTFVGWFNDSANNSIEVTGNSIVPNTNTTLTAHWARVGKITNVGANKCLNIYGSNLTSLTNGKNITLWSDSGSNEQRWLVEWFYFNKIYIRSVIDQSYGLNVYRAGSPWNCNVHQVIGNETDAQVDLIWYTTGTYWIKLSNYDLYLTAGGSSNGSNVYWSSYTGSSYQLWHIEWED